MCVGKLQLVLLPQAWASSSKVGPILAQDAACVTGIRAESSSLAFHVAQPPHSGTQHISHLNTWTLGITELSPGDTCSWAPEPRQTSWIFSPNPRWSPVWRWVVITCPSQNPLLMSPGLPGNCRTPARCQLHSRVAIFIILFRYYWLLKWYIFNKIEVKWR